MDWKDSLAALRDSVIPAEETSPETEDNSTIELSQTSPVKIILDKKGRKGKVATIIEGFTIPREKVEEIARILKQKLGVGGSVREGEILIQGDHKEKAKKILADLKFKTLC